MLGHHRLLLAGSTVLAVAQRLRLVPKRVGLPTLPLRRGKRVESTGDDVWLFTGCVMDAWQRETHRATATVLSAVGVTVRVPGRGGDCCGALHTHAGLSEASRRLAEAVMASMPGDAPIIVNSAGCGAALEEYGHLLATPEAQAFSARVVDAQEFVAPRVEALRPRRRLGAVVVQDPCHLRHVQRAHLHTRAVLAAVADVVELDDDGLCCGAGGAYSALLGAATEGGIPQGIFANGEARWLEVSYTSADGSVVTQPRVLLVSVPYALKAGDAQTLGGLPASAFVLNTDAVASRVNDAGGLPGATINEVLPAAAVSGTGTAGKITKWTDGAGTLADSIITEAGGKIGINAAAPAAPLQVGTVGGLIPTTWAALINGRLGLINGNQATYFVQQSGVGELSTYDYGTNQGMPLALNMNGGNVGIATNSPDSTLDVRGSINQIIYLRPNGSTDGTQINSAISALPASGGIIYLQPGTWTINTTINITKHGVKLRGYGSAQPGTPSPGVPATKLRWTGSSGGTIISAIGPSSTTIEGLEISDLTLDGDNLAGLGLYMEFVYNSSVRNLDVYYMTTGSGVGVKLKNCSWNLFERCSVYFAQDGLELDGTSITSSNSCHNTFMQLNIQQVQGVGIRLRKCDNNGFFDCITPGTAAVGVQVEDPIEAISNYFHHLQPGGARGFRILNAQSGYSGDKNLIFGYDLDNGETQPDSHPNATTSQFLFWTDSKGNIHGGAIV